jgi:hypothetical protein
MAVMLLVAAVIAAADVGEGDVAAGGAKTRVAVAQGPVTEWDAGKVVAWYTQHSHHHIPPSLSLTVARPAEARLPRATCLHFSHALPRQLSFMALCSTLQQACRFEGK